MKKNFIIPVSFLFLGAALGFSFAAAHSETPKCKKCAESAREEKAVKTARQRRAENDAENKSLRRRVRELEAEKAQAAVSEEAVGQERAERQLPPRMERGGNWLANLKTEDPERYQQITNGMARWRNDRAAQTKSRIDFLSSVDTSKMSRQARETHEKLQALYVERENLQASLDEMMMAGGEISGEDRRKLFEQMRDTTREINSLSAQERENLIKQTAETLGFKGEDVGEIAATIKGIIDATETGHNMQRFLSPRNGARSRRGGSR